jgi:cellulose synthase (UDP-forming)
METQDLLLPLLMLLAAAALLPVLDARNPLHRVPVLVVAILVLIAYSWWRTTVSLPALGASFTVFWQYTFFAAEALAMIYTTWSLVTFLRRRDRHHEADRGEAALRQRGARVPGIDLLVPTYNEPREILEATLQASVNIDYPNFQVWFLDDGDRDWLRDLCAERGAGYIRRAEHNHAKGGNLDNGVRATSADYIACIDADFTPLPHMFYRMAGILEDPEIGLVQAPQHFRNADPIQKNLGGREAWTEEQRVFFDVALPARDGWDNALCVGSCWMTRRDVLDRLGGYPYGTIAEDVLFGYACKTTGYRTAYLNEPVALGLAAEDIATYLTQRSRWSQGAMQLLHDKLGPFRAPNLTLLDRIFYFDISFFWFGYLTLAVIVLAPLLYGFFGVPAFSCTMADVVTWILPRLIVPTAVIYWVSEGRALPIITPIKKYISLFHVIPAMLGALVNPRGLAFKVSTKGGDSNRTVILWNVMWPFATLFALTLLSIFATYSHETSRFAWSDYTAINVALAGYNLIVLFLCCLACVERPPTPDEQDAPQFTTGDIGRSALAIFRRLWN